LETSHQPLSNVAGLPPPGAGLIGMFESPSSAPSPLIAALPRPLARSKDPISPVGGPVKIKPTAATRRLSVAVGPFLARALDVRWQTYREQLRQCQDEFSEEAVHELRVATRRLLAQCVLLNSAAPSSGLEKVRRILKRRLVALGDLRDVHIQRMFVDQTTARFSELALLRAWLQRRERRLAKSAAEKVRRFKHRKLERWMSAMIGELLEDARSSRAQSRLASALMRATSSAFAETVERRRAIDLTDLRTIHQTRVAFKRFRYMVESLSPALTGLSKRQLRRLAYYQRKMGIIQDLEVMRHCVARFTQEHRKTDELLRAFCGHLRRRRARALRSFLRTANRLYEFWPPARLAAPGDSASARNAA
jgi:CHAD domain-containing protein